jgi:hypothetical protein
MATYYLTHSGIKGMKWGVRRYQNSDGTLTPAGKKRYDRDIRENNAKKKDNRIVIDGPDADRWAREDLSRTKNVVDGSHTLVKQAKSINDSLPSKRQTMDLSKMSDQEMRARINRAQLEKQYNDIFNAPQKSKGREVAGKILETTGTILGIGSTALGIALAVKELKPKG